MHKSTLTIKPVFSRCLTSTFLLGMLLTTMGCTGGGSSSNESSTPFSSSSGNPSPKGGDALPAPTWNSGIYEDWDKFDNICANYSESTDEFTGIPIEKGTEMHEKMFLRSISNDLYLWFEQLADINPNPLPVDLYFDRLKTPDDRFHFIESYQDYFNFQQGTSRDYGVTWDFEFPEDGFDAYRIRASFVEPASPNFNIIKRGDSLLAIDGLTVGEMTNSQVDEFFARLFPTEDTSHIFRLEDINGQTREVTATATTVSYAAAPLLSIMPSGNDNIGYLLFNSHDGTAQQSLVRAFNEFSNNGIDDLILDLRYNGGGLLRVASQLGYMIAGAEQTSGKLFERLAFNSKLGYYDPFTEGESNTYFLDSTVDSLGAPDQALPSVDLDRVFVLTSDNTCSASESLINGLRGIGLEVIQIGNTTCGKPYGFYPIPNCGSVYYTVMFKGENAAGYGDFDEGFSPAGSFGSVDEDTLPGCLLAEDYKHELGDRNERLLAAALQYRNDQTCPPENNILSATALIPRSLRAPPTIPTSQAVFKPKRPGKILAKPGSHLNGH